MISPLMLKTFIFHHAKSKRNNLICITLSVSACNIIHNILLFMIYRHTVLFHYDRYFRNLFMTRKIITQLARICSIIAIHLTIRSTSISAWWSAGSEKCFIRVSRIVHIPYVTEWKQSIQFVYLICNPID